MPEYGQQRAGAHTDYGSLTILLPQPDTSGLQLKLNGKWINQWIICINQVYFAAITLISILASSGIRAASSTILAGKSWVK